MKKNINYILIVTISLTSLFTGCTKVTEQVNESGISQSSFYLDKTVEVVPPISVQVVPGVSVEVVPL